MKRMLKRIAFGLVAWAATFALAELLINEFSELALAFLPFILPFVYFALAWKCIKIKQPGWGGEGLKIGGIWLLVAALIDFVVLPYIGEDVYRIYLESLYHYIIYAELLFVPWLADKVMTSVRKI